MKKIRLLIAIALLMCAGLTTYAQKDRTLTNGFSVNLVLGVPSAAYGVEDADDIDDEFKLGALFGVQIGNRWYFNPSETSGFGLMVNWFDFTLSAKGGSEGSTDWGRAVMDISFLEVGPVGTFALSDEMAIDAYYNLRPTVLSSAVVIESSFGDETYGYAGFGISHAFGAAFRYKVFNVGVEYVVGGINAAGTYSGDYNVDLEDQKIKANSFRIMLGVKF
jgi:hypothetical protein